MDTEDTATVVENGTEIEREERETVVENGTEIEKEQNDVNKEKEKRKIEPHPCYQSFRLALNLVINILICLTVFVCLLYACSGEFAMFELHIILSVLGYQFVMCQATLVVSRYNSWSMLIKRRYRKHIHWVMQVIAAAMVLAGTVLIALQKSTHFDTTHGQLALAALLCCFLSLLNGILTIFAARISESINMLWVRLFHYFTGIFTLFLAAGSLCEAFKYDFFRTWTSNEVFVPILIYITWIFTALVSLDFWIWCGIRIRNRF
ncbi:hypothetical protein B5X24_HaOG207003 [Helicoverpa armigera]|nr:hypothetical protein B5X24_HaOG207003 [Helicoverpa armigera]